MAGAATVMHKMVIDHGNVVVPLSTAQIQLCSSPMPCMQLQVLGRTVADDLQMLRQLLQHAIALCYALTYVTDGWIAERPMAQ